MRKIKPFGRTYNRRVLAMAAFINQTYPCCHCGNPVHDGYCCQFCRSANPGAYDDWEDQLHERYGEDVPF